MFWPDEYRPRFLRRGRWVPGMQPDLSFCVMLLLGFEAFMRGVDYFTGDRHDLTTSLTVVERAMPLQMWGVLLMACGGTFFAGVVLRRFMPIIVGAVIAFGAYGALAVGMVAKMVERGLPIDGWRSPIMFTVVSLFFAAYALSTYFKRAVVHVDFDRDRDRDDGDTSEVGD